MKIKFVLFAILLLISSFGFAQVSSVRFTFATQSATGKTSGFTPGGVMWLHTIEIATTGSPAACTGHLEGSPKDSPADGDYVDMTGDITCTAAATMVHIAEKSVSSVRWNQTALSGGATTTVTYNGIR